MSHTPSPRQQLLQQRDALHAELESALEDEADPLAAHDNLIRWILQNYVNHSDSGLLETLEETVRRFKDDMRYKTGDLRYVKLWILFANHVNQPVLVYAYMMEEGIGKLYALFFEEYAESLEREGRYTEAETVMTLGIKNQAKPLKRLQRFQSDYHTRRATGKALPAKVSPFREGSCSAKSNLIRTDPLRNIAPRRLGSIIPSNLAIPPTGQGDVSMTTIQPMQPTAPARRNPYIHLNAPTVPGKKPEKLRFDLTLLLEPDGTEYSFEEARARYLGLLGKKWPPPPPPNASVINNDVVLSDCADAKERSIQVDFNDQGTKSGRGARRQSVTVTINTKQALKDVLDMYNSPVKEHLEAEVIEARPQAVETPTNLRTPASASSRSSAFHDENAGVTATKPRAFQPHLDQKRENITPGLLKFKPVTTKTTGTNAFTPNVARKALVTKELVAPVPAFKVVRPEKKDSMLLKPLTEEKEEPSDIDVFGGDDVTTGDFTEDFTNPVSLPPPPRSFVPFVDENTSDQPLPASQSKNVPPRAPAKILKFQVHRDEIVPSVPPVRQRVIGDDQPSLSFSQLVPQEEERHPSDKGEGIWDASQDVSGGDELQENEDRHRFATSGRFANFDVMTPITERTFEFTVSTRAADTPRTDQPSACNRGVVASDAQDIAEQLAAELRKEETQEQDAQFVIDPAVNILAPLLGSEFSDIGDIDDSGSKYPFTSFDQVRAPFRLSDGFIIEPNQNNLFSSAIVVDKSITANLTEVLVNPSDFNPSNPCNPSDPAVVSNLLSLLPSEPNHRELRDRVANNLDKMQRFAEKRIKSRSSGSGSGGILDGSDKFNIELENDRFEIFDKLGEGTFGAVFMAKDLSKARRQFEEDGDADEDDEDDELVAVKAVRPSNLWESYVLRRVINALPDDLRRSIIHPHRLYAFKDESFLILDLCQQGTLLEIVNRATEIGISQPGGGVDELLVMFFTVEILRILQGLHDRGFIHGDLKIDNCLIRLDDVPGGTSAWSGAYNPAGDYGWTSKGIKLIDFGRTIDTKLYPPGQTFVADWKTDARDCIEMREGRPWTFQTDYSGLASITYCMLFAKYIETAEVTGPDGIRKLKLAQPMKRYWQVDLWNRFFDMLLNPCHLRQGGSLPITEELGVLRMELEDWIQANCNKAGKNLKGMLKKIEIASLRRMSRK